MAGEAITRKLRNLKDRLRKELRKTHKLSLAGLKRSERILNLARQLRELADGVAI